MCANDPFDGTGRGTPGLLVFHYVVGGLAVLFSLMPVVFLVIVGLTLSTCILLAARYIRRCERYYFCLAVAAAVLVFVPVGTLMGVLTILVLQRESVKATVL